MKHQLFKKGKYVQIDVNKSHLDVISKVKDSTIVRVFTRTNDVYNFPQQAIQIDSALLIIQENPDISPILCNDIIFIKDLVKRFNNIVVREDKLYVNINKLSLPGQEYKNLYHKLIKGAKQT